MFDTPAKIVCILSLILFSFNACTVKDKNIVIYFEKTKTDSQNSTLKWLADKDNFRKSSYFETFEKYYCSNINNKNYIAASKALEIVSIQEINFEQYSERFFQIVTSFRDNYGQEIGEKKLGFLYFHIGSYQINQNYYKKAIENFKKIIAIGDFDYKSCEDVAYAYCDIGFCYSAIGEQNKAMEANLKSITYFDKNGNQDAKAVSYGNIALVHLFSKNYKKAELFFDKAIAHYNSSENIAIGMHNKTILYEEINDPKMYALIDSTYKYFNKSNVDNGPLKIAVYTYYVKKLLYDKDYKSAKVILNECKELVEDLNSGTSSDDYYSALAEYELATMDQILDTNLMLRALHVAEENDHYQNQMIYNGVLLENAIKNENFKQALFYSQKYDESEDKLATREIIAKTMELNEKHKATEKEHEIKIQKQTITAKNSTILIMILTLIAFALVAAVLYFRRKKNKILLKSKKAILFTKQLFEKTEEERKRIASDLHDSVSHELLALKSSKGFNIEEDKKAIDAIINDVRNISRNLHPIMFEKIGLRDSVQHLIDRLQASSDILINSEIDYHKNLSLSDELQVYRIIQEALTNIIKYAKAVAAKVEIREKNGVLFLKIIDNGIGFDVAKQMNSNQSFGIHNILERSKAVGGVPKIISSSKGTRIEIEIKN
jgi:two-component system NarL family sensor kinase